MTKIEEVARAIHARDRLRDSVLNSWGLRSPGDSAFYFGAARNDIKDVLANLDS